MKRIYLIQQSEADENIWRTIYAVENEKGAKQSVNEAIKRWPYLKFRIRECTLYSR